MSARPPASVHATAVAIGERGILIRGPSGAGKSRLALALIDMARRDGKFARLVGDDRVFLTVANGRVLARPHSSIAGLIEDRGAGILQTLHEPSVSLACVIALAGANADDLPRLPDADEFTDVGGVDLPQMTIASQAGPEEAARRVLAFLNRLRP